MGCPKVLLKLDSGCPWVTWQLQQFFAAGGHAAVVVLAHQTQAVEFTVLDNLTPFGRSVTVTRSSAPDLGPFASLVAGLHLALKWDLNQYAVMPVDVPAARQETWRRLENGLGGVDVVVPEFSGRGGHPVVMSRRFAQALLELPLHQARLDTAIGQWPPDRVRRLTVDDARVIMNLNSRQDWQQARSLLQDAVKP